MSSSPRLANAFTVDVEEWFHILDAEEAPDPKSWESLESRVEIGTERLLELLDTAGVRATFFFLSWVAERHPELVRRVAEGGHEIATHGYAHRLVYRGDAASFREDTRRARGVLEDITGRPVEGYRAAGFSITRETPWAFDVLAEEGFRYDSSVFPAKRAHGGLDLDRERPFRIAGPSGPELWEFPIVPARFGPGPGSLRIPFAGGGYLRLWPLGLLLRAARGLNRRGVPVTWYLHPREVDVEQPRLQLPWRRRFKYYVNLAGTTQKLQRLLERAGPFEPLAELCARLDAEPRVGTDPPLRLRPECRRPG
jgi:polysaccharide deacetylase family protein (PEP-CTERM system associated)